MRNLPLPPADANVRALGQIYVERFTDSTATALTLTYQPVQTQDEVDLIQVYKNGKLLTTTAQSTTTNATTPHQDTRTGSTSTTWTLGNTPDSGTLLLFKNGALLRDPADYTISGATITLASAPVSGDWLLASYATTTSTTSSAGTSYTLSGQTITLDEALVAADQVVVHYPYRT